MVVSANTFFDGSRQLPSPPKTGASISITLLLPTGRQRNAATKVSALGPRQSNTLDGTSGY
jgi:hypothetical protein